MKINEVDSDLYLLIQQDFYKGMTVRLAKIENDKAFGKLEEKGIFYINVTKEVSYSIKISNNKL